MRTDDPGRRPSTISRRTLTKPVSCNSGKRHQMQFTARRTITDCCLTKGVQYNR
jgi:hypothetical protein